jgi:DNA-binding NtrC family response regulator
MIQEKILIVDDTPTNLRLLAESLEQLGYEILAANEGSSGVRIAEKARPSLILLDVIMPFEDGMSVCKKLKESEATKDIPIIFITARQESASILSGFQAGAVDYIQKPFNLEEVVTRVETHLKIGRLNRELRARNQQLEEEIERRQRAEEAQRTADERFSRIAADEASRWGISGFIGESKLVRKILEDIQRLHRFANTSVMIQGESGTGKELVSRAIHYGSPRASAPFIAVNCVAIPPDLAESLLFGHVKGAFTGAIADRKGWFELAHGGTLFLDEIGDMPLPLQGKLLRVLEDHEIVPLGGTKPIRVDIRLITATNADLPARIVNGEFRQDLFFRLARYIVETPPLRERRDDISLLVHHFMGLFAKEMGMPAPSVDDEAMALLQSHAFPGNIRELKNVIERALIESGGSRIQVRHIHFLHSVARRQLPSKPQAHPSNDTLPMNLDEAEQFLIRRALDQAGGNVAEAARMLGVNRSRIYRRLPQEA